jgi:hypothetical protein
MTEFAYEHLMDITNTADTADEALAMAKLQIDGEIIEPTDDA